jgi:hypothetical protein
MLLAALALLFGIPAATSAASAATGTGWIRFGNLSATSSPVDVYLYSSSSSSSPTTVEDDLAYPTVSSYQAVTPGDYTVKVRAAGSSASSTPLDSASISVQANHAYTVTTLQGKLKVLDDSLNTPAGKSLVQVIQASNQANVTFHCSCAAGAPGNVATNAAPGSVSPYVPIPPGQWTMTATGPSANASRFVPLTADTVHTEVVVDTTTGLGILDLLSAVGDQPTVGGVGTGFGGTAPHGPGSPLPWLALIAAGALVTLAGGVRLRRSRLRRAATGA